MKFLISILLLVSAVPALSVSKQSLVGGRYAFSSLSEWDNGYPEERYEEILAAFRRVYSPIIEAKGGKLQLLVDWSDGAVNMWAWRTGDEYWLEVPGGMARYYLIKEEGFIQSICHELGHLLGGAPARGDISYEGQSDYFASLKCMKLMLAEVEPYQVLIAPTEVQEICADVVHLKTSICQRSLMGALSLTSYYAKLERAKVPVFSTPSTEQARSTYSAHPPAQCRLDTMLAGTLCDNNKELSLVDPEMGTCGKDTVGARPGCWYQESLN